MHKKQLNGLETLEKFKDGTYSAPTMAVTIPMKIISVERGSIEIKTMASDMHLNPMGGVHGGFAATVLDSATGAAVHTMLDPGESYGTVDLNVKMMRPVPREKDLRAKGKVIHLSRRLGISEATLKDNEGKIYGQATSTCMILRKEKRSNVITLKSQEIKVGKTTVNKRCTK